MPRTMAGPLAVRSIRAAIYRIGGEEVRPGLSLAPGRRGRRARLRYRGRVAVHDRRDREEVRCGEPDHDLMSSRAAAWLIAPGRDPSSCRSAAVTQLPDGGL